MILFIIVALLPFYGLLTYKVMVYFGCDELVTGFFSIMVALFGFFAVVVYLGSHGC